MGDIPNPFACLNLSVGSWHSAEYADQLYPTLDQIPEHIPSAYYGMAAMLMENDPSRFGAMDYDDDTVSIWEVAYLNERLVLMPKEPLKAFELSHALLHLAQAATASHVRPLSVRLATTAWLLWRWFEIKTDAAYKDVKRLYLIQVERPLSEDGRRSQRNCGILETEAEASKATAILKNRVPENEVGYEHVRFFSTGDELANHSIVGGFLTSTLGPADAY